MLLHHPLCCACRRYTCCSSRTYPGFTFQVGVRVEEEDMLTGARHHCCSAYLTFVSVMARPAPGRAAKPLPKITPASPHQREIFRAGQLSPPFLLPLQPPPPTPPLPPAPFPSPQKMFCMGPGPSCVGASSKSLFCSVTPPSRCASINRDQQRPSMPATAVPCCLESSNPKP